MDKRILIVDDELSIREFLEILLVEEGYQVTTARSGAEALEKINDKDFHMVISDIQMPKLNGIEVLKRVKEISPSTEVIMITAYASAESAVEALKCGAYDYMTKPFKVDEIKLILQKAFEKIALQNENLLLKKELKESFNFGDIVGASDKMMDIYNLIKKVAPTMSNILITGESGTGKELVAKAIHSNSRRSEHPFITVNCGAMAENLLESELYGHKKGAFTGAISNKRGLFELARGGSIFLDEIGDTPLALQVKLLRVIQEKEFRRVGDTENLKTDVRIIAASNRGLEEEARQGSFREDLYYRLNVIQIKLPPLRKRKEDLPSLVDHFIRKYNRELGRKILRISSEAMTVLQGYDFPGNIRELENIIEHAVALEVTDIILAETLSEEVREKEHSEYTDGMEIPDEGVNIDKIMEDVEKDLLMKSLKLAAGVKTRAAKLLNVSFRSFRYRLAKYGLDDEEN
ncbi:MAG: sigma-54-dependent Fis family transcriptional regulator [Proteobacteria bacterium]|nr:sigma-54-dependent Fis family transcriptional regulator [Pseudomonadota bacterium]